MAERSEGLVSLFIQPDVRRQRVTVSVETPDGSDVRIAIEGGPQVTASSAGEIRLDFPDCELWSPAQPNLYTLRCEPQAAGKGWEAVDCRFGMREFTVKDHRFSLNQRQIYLQGVTLSGRVQTGCETRLSKTPDPGAIKETGFNAVRLSGGLDIESFLETADELGLLVCLTLDCEDGPPDVCGRFAMYRNHPSLVAWVVEDGPPEVWKQLREVDPSRLILVDAAGVEESGSPSFFVRPYRSVPEPFDPLEAAFACPSERLVERYLAYLGEPEELSVVMELGGEIAAREQIAEDHSPGPPREHPERSSTHSGDAALEFLELRASSEILQVDALRSSANIAGYFLDGGFLLSDGRPGSDNGPGQRSSGLTGPQAPVRPVLRLAKQNLTPREEVPVSILLLNEHRLEGRADLSLQVVGPTRQVLWKKKREVKIPRGGKELWSGSISASGSTGPHRFVVRLMKDMKCLAENSVEFFVFDPAERWDGQIHLLDRDGRWASRCSSMASLGTLQAPIHVVPPLANTISAYPENEVVQILGQVKEGAVAIFFEPPDDWNDLAQLIDPEISATSRPTVGPVGPAFHVAKLHPVFDGLPAGGLMGWPYRDLLPRKTFPEHGEEEICNCFAHPGTEEEGLLEIGNDILVRRYGSGRVVFTHFRVLDYLGTDPVADRLFVNLLKHFSRRSVRANADFPIHQRMVEWMRATRTESVRRWMVIGMFSNWGGLGHDATYPPEESVSFDATYPGWYGAAAWRPWFALSANDFQINIEEAAGFLNSRDRLRTTGTGYAYSECSSDRRREGHLTFRGHGAVKIWFNGKLVHSRNEDVQPGSHCEEIEVFLKQGRNTILVKQSSRNSSLGFSVDLDRVGAEPDVRWW